MKKGCVPQNNAITINTPINCPVPVVPATNVCVDPFTYTWNLAVAKAIQDGTPVDLALAKILEQGLVIPTGSNICCPTCSAAPFYSLSNTDTFLVVATVLGWTNGATPAINYCCINYEMGVQTYGKFIGLLNPTCCSNNFSSCLAQLAEIIDLSIIQASGIVETNTLNGETLLCKLAELYNTIPSATYLTDDDATTMFTTFLQSGFFAYCCGCNIVIGNSAAFTKYLQTGGCPDIVIP